MLRSLGGLGGLWMTKQSLKDNFTSNDILSKNFWILTIPKMSFYWCLLKKKFEKIEGDLLAHVHQKQNTFLAWTVTKFDSECSISASFMIIAWKKVEAAALGHTAG